MKSCFYISKKKVVRVILRDENGNTIMVVSIPENYAQHAEIVEALAIFRGLQQCLHQVFPILLLNEIVRW